VRVQVEFRNVTCRIVRADDYERDWLRQLLTFRTVGATGVERPMCLLDEVTQEFPSGFLPIVQARAAKELRTLDVLDLRPASPECDHSVDLSWLRDYQLEAVHRVIERERGILWIPTAGGKCLGLNTEVLLYSGHTKKVQDVLVGDLLMGPDSKPRRVLSTSSGWGPLFRVVPHRAASWVCNDVHVLTLIETESGNIIDIALNQYLQKSKWFKHIHKQFAVSVDFPEADPLPMDPYFLGVWYGDGSKTLTGVKVTKPDPEIRELMQGMADKYGMILREDVRPNKCKEFRITNGRGKPNPLLRDLRNIVGDCTQLPHQYLTASRQDREAFLAGLLDTDGCLSKTGYEIAKVRKRFAEDICFLARSLGLTATMKEKVVKGKSYWRVHIYGDCTSLPLRIERKKPVARKMNKHAGRQGFTVESAGYGDFYGFTLDGDGRFLMGDFVVTHNTATASSIVSSFPTARWLFLVHRLSLLNQTADSFKRFTSETAGKVGESGWRPRRFTVATFQTLAARLANGDAEARALLESVDGVIVDEAHALAASTFTTVMGVATNARYRIGLSGTPLARGDRKSSLVVGATGPVIYRMRPEVLVEREVLARPTILMIDCWQDELEDATWPTVYDRLVVHSARRNALVVEAVRRSEKPALVFVQAVEHGQVLMRAFARVGIRAAYVHGAHTIEQREAAIEQLVAGRLEVLVCSVIFQEGVDVPALRSVVIAAGGQSTIAAIQRVGRGLRKSEGKTSCVVWEVLDRGQRWLEAHARARRLAYQAEGYEVRVEHLGETE
jgi:superfamily II DNA or RNA helicase